MKKVLLSFIASFAIFSAFSQLPCVQSYATGNLGGGDCPTAGSGNNKYFPGYPDATSASPGYTPTGKITVFFKTAVPAGTAAPIILAAGVDAGGGVMTQPPFDYKYAPYNDNSTVSRLSITYCYYGSASNQNIFNGSKAPKLVFQIQYIGSGTQNCGGVIGPGPLPVNFKSFTASKANITNTLKWTTSFESNSKGFYVQRFYAGKWENVTFVASKADGGLSNTDLNYSFSDVFSFKGAVQYRIQQVDFDGQTKLSQICSLVNGTTGNVLIYPNPGVANGVISIVLPDASSSYGIQILDNTGRMIKEFTSARNTQQVSSLARGQYMARIKDENGQIMVEKFIVQ